MIKIVIIDSIGTLIELPASSARWVFANALKPGQSVLLIQLVITLDINWISFANITQLTLVRHWGLTCEQVSPGRHVFGWRQGKVQSQPGRICQVSTTWWIRTWQMISIIQFILFFKIFKNLTSGKPIRRFSSSIS